MIPEFLFDPVLGKPLGLWLIFITIVGLLLAFDLGVLNRKDHEIGVRESLWLSLFYIVMACIFGAWVWMSLDAERGMNFFTAYVIEKSLSLDNIFVMSVIFHYFAVPRKYQHRVLFWGILGVIVLRGIMIGFGTALVAEFDWVLLLFAAFLIVTGIKMLFMGDDDEPDIENSRVLNFLKKHLNVTQMYHGRKFFVRLPRGGKSNVLHATPLFLALVCIEFADVLFALDSVPAVFAITTDTYIVYTSNIFAILGLRALYFALAAVLHRFSYMKYALSIVLVFIGAKAFYGHFFGKIAPEISLSITLGVLIVGFIYSFYKTRKEQKAD